MRQLFYNDDCSNLFLTREFRRGLSGEVIDQNVDGVADAGVTVFLCNTNARRVNYESRVWEPFWKGYDPKGPDDQPFLAAVPRDGVAAYRNSIANMLVCHEDGIDYPGRVLARCRYRGVSPWVSLRMNDCHNNDIEEHPIHDSFWKNNPRFRRRSRPDYFAKCLDYARREVRDYYMALVVETLERYDIDGLELDFMREPFVFSEGEEAKGSAILTDWIREIRKRVDDVAAGRRHPIRLGVRVPSHPEVALAHGLDSIFWAREGLIDLLVATPRWSTLEFDMPMEQWREKLEGLPVTLAGGIELLYRPHPAAVPIVCTPELAHGAAALVLSRGADAVYLFNYFQSNPGWRPPIYKDAIGAMASLDSLLKQPRRIAVTYRDITVPTENYQPPLPAMGREVVFNLKLGPIPGKDWNCELLVGLSPAGDAPSVVVNGNKLKDDSLRLVTMPIPIEALADNGDCEVRLSSGDGNPLTVERVELAFREPV